MQPTRESKNAPSHGILSAINDKSQPGVPSIEHLDRVHT